MGGQEKRVLAEAAGLAERGHYLVIVCREKSRIKVEAERLGLNVHILPLRKPYDAVSIFQLRSFMKAQKFDVVNTHSGVDSWIGGIAARLSGTPVLVRTRHLNIPLKRNIFNFIHYVPDLYISCGENMRNMLVNNCGFPENKVVSIPTGTDLKYFAVSRRNEVKVKYGLAIDAPVITNVGILRSVKGHEVTLHAVKKVISASPDARFLIVGDGPRQAKLERMVKDLGISEYVIFTGFVDNIPEIYSFSDAAVLSSWSEGLPQSLLQAMASCVPVIATGVGGVSEVVINEKTGILVDAGDHEALAQGIIMILEDPDLGSGLAENGKELVFKEYSLKHMIDRIEGLYNKLLNNKV